jgi:glycosyltransferase involved in cell wall biosynthesis
LQAAKLLSEPGLKPSAAVRYYIVGGPIYQTQGSQFSEAELRALAERLGLAGQVAFVPFQRDTPAVYRALDVVVHASTLPEPFGRTIVEAMACERPVVVSEAGGAAELFRSGADAVGFPPGNATALAQALGLLIDDPARRAAIAGAARLSAVQRFNRDRLGAEVATIYRRTSEHRLGRDHAARDEAASRGA